MSAAVPLPCVQPVRISTIFCEPTRQGTHLPQDSLRKNFTAFRAMSSMQRPSAQTTIAPEPSIEPTAASDLKSSRTSTIEAGRYPDEGPDGANAFSFVSAHDSAGLVEDHFRHRQCPWDLEYAGLCARRR